MRRPRSAATTVLPVAVLIAWAQVEAWLPAARLTPLDGPAPAVAAGALAMSAPLLWRARLPLLVALVVAGAFAVESLLLAPPDSPARICALVLAAGSLGARAPMSRASAGLVAVLLLVLTTDPGAGVDALFTVLVLATPWTGGVLVRRYRLLAAELAEQREELARRREETARLAAAAERARIAREMHDVLAHTLSHIVVQAEAVDQLLDRPDRARPWLRSLSGGTREALDEVRRLVGALRSADPDPHGAAELDAGIPGLSDVERLVRQNRDSGLPVDLVAGTVPPVSPSTGLAAYRIVQEALTNVRRHASASAVTVELGDEDGDLLVVVRDDGVGCPPGRVTTGGHGLVGITERAALSGGHATAGPRPDGGFEVRARLPAAVTAQ